MWFLLIFSFLTTLTLPAHGVGDDGMFKDYLLPVKAFNPAHFDKKSSSHEKELRTLLQQTRTKFFSNGKPYEDSWLHQFEQLIDEYAKANGFLKELKKAAETKWNGKTYEITTITFSNGEKGYLPTVGCYQKSEHYLAAFYESVIGMIDDFEDVCFGDDFVKIFRKLKIMESFDSDLMKFQIEAALKSIKKPLQKLKEDSENFNYDEYFKKLSEIHMKICISKASFGQFEPLLKEINVEFDATVKMTESWYERNKWALNKIQDITTIMEIDGMKFMKEMESIFGKNERIATDLSKMEIVTINDLDKKLNAIVDKQSKIYKFLFNIRTVLVYSFTIEKRLEILEYDMTIQSLRPLQSPVYSIHGVERAVPASEKIDKINKIIFGNLAGITQSAWFIMDEIFSSDSAVALYGTFNSIDLNMNIPDDIFDSVKKLATEMQLYLGEIENVGGALRFALPELIHCTNLAREAKNLDVFLLLKSNPPHTLWSSFNEQIFKSVIRVAYNSLITSIERPKRAKNSILMAQRKLLDGIGPIVQVDLDQKYQYPTPLSKKSKTVTFDIKTTVGSEEFDNILLDKFIDEKIKLFDGKRKSEHEKNKSLPTAINPSTKSALNALKMIVSHVYEMYGQLRSNRAELERNNPNELQQTDSDQSDSDQSVDKIKYPKDISLREIDDRRKSLIKIIEYSMNALKSLCSGDIHEKILETLKGIENDPEINEKIDLKNIQTKYDEFKRINHGVVIAKFTNAIVELRKIAMTITNSPNPNEMLENTKSRRTKFINELRTADQDFNEKMQTTDGIIADIQVIDVLEKLNNIFFGKLIDEKIKQSLDKSTKMSLDSIKKVTNYAYEMYDRLKCNWFELKIDISKRFESMESTVDPVTKYPDNKTLREIENIRKSILNHMKMSLNELKQFCNGDMHKQILETVKLMEKDWIISEKIDLKNIGLKYNQFKQLFANDETVKKFKKVNSEFRKLIVELRQNPKEMLEKSKDRRDALINELKTAMDHLNIKIQNAKEIILEMKVIEVLGKINSIFFGKLIDEKIKLIHRTNYPTRMALEALNSIYIFAYEMNTRLKFIWSELERDNLNAIKQFNMEIVKGTIGKYPNYYTLEEIKDKRNILIRKIAEILVELKHRYNGDIHKQIIETVSIIEADSYPAIDKPIDLKNIAYIYNEFMQIIQDKTLSEFLNAISKIREIIDGHRNGPITSETYKELEKSVNGFMEELRTADEFLQEKIKKAHDFIFDIQFIEVLREITNTLLDKMPKDPEDANEIPSTNPNVKGTSKLVPTLRRVPTTIHKGILPKRSSINLHNPLSKPPGDKTQSELDDDDDADNEKGMIIDPPSAMNLELQTESSDKGKEPASSLELLPPVDSKPPPTSGEPSKKKSIEALHQESQSGTSLKKPSGISKHEERPGTPPSPRTAGDSKPVSGSSSTESSKKSTEELETRSTTPPPSRTIDSKTLPKLSIVTDPSKILKHEQQSSSSNTGSSSVSPTVFSPSQSILETSEDKPLVQKKESLAISGQSPETIQTNRVAPMSYQEPDHRNDEDGNGRKHK